MEENVLIPCAFILHPMAQCLKPLSTWSFSRLVHWMHWSLTSHFLRVKKVQCVCMQIWGQITTPVSLSVTKAYWDVELRLKLQYSKICPISPKEGRVKGRKESTWVRMSRGGWVITNNMITMRITVLQNKMVNCIKYCWGWLGMGM
jgi:hypothetical protein